ncbi:hypothetical protein QYF36_013430 [Acer negundo]|nr:hypothetical protein QYF36_013430 [Acer negundo]
MEMDQRDCSMKVDKLIEKHAWIASEKQLFGRSGTDYDFVSRDPLKAIEELRKLQAEKLGLEKRVNKKVMTMFEKAEDEYNDLMSKKSIIESLSELSGGQRSLLALSLILALLLFKPAPLHILDEFIVVSLKQGMFNNANVLFRTKFVDGVSTVQRTVAKQSK